MRQQDFRMVESGGGEIPNLPQKWVAASRYVSSFSAWQVETAATARATARPTARAVVFIFLFVGWRGLCWLMVVRMVLSLVDETLAFVSLPAPSRFA